MKKLLSFCLTLIFLLYSTPLIACYVPCDSYAMQKSNEAQLEIGIAYTNLDNKILESENVYKEYLSSLEKQNELLEKITKARKLNTQNMKRVNFLLKKIIENKNITIDTEILNALKKLNKQIIYKEK